MSGEAGCLFDATECRVKPAGGVQRDVAGLVPFAVDPQVRDAAPRLGGGAAKRGLAWVLQVTGTCHMEVATESRALRPRVRKASRVAPLSRRRRASAGSTNAPARLKNTPVTPGQTENSWLVPDVVSS
jgi:hypothetical protein